MSDHNFDRAIALNGDADNCINSIHPAYQNIVGPFGGTSAAVLLNTVLQHPKVKGTPVTITVNYLAPIEGETLNIQPRLIKNNRSNQHWSIEAQCDGQPVLTATLVMAIRRDTWANTEITCPQSPHYSELESLSLDMLPPWSQQYDFRFVRGGLEGPLGDIPSESLEWISSKPSRKLDFAALCAVCDTFFPRLLVRHKTFAPFGTVSFTVYFHVGQEELDTLENDWVLGHARASKFHGSYFDQTAEIWGCDQSLLATTSQIVYYKY